MMKSDRELRRMIRKPMPPAGQRHRNRRKDPPRGGRRGKYNRSNGY